MDSRQSLARAWRITAGLICCIFLAGCKSISAISPLTFNYDHSPDDIVLYADVQSHPGGCMPGDECLCEYRPRLRIWGDGLVYVNIAWADQPPPFRWQGQFDQNKITELLRFLKAGVFFNSWNPGDANPAGTWFQMGVNLKMTQVQYSGGDLDPPLYHELIYEHILPSLIPLPESGENDERIDAILREAEDCYRRVFGTPTP